jgi:hypothetical protein
VGEVARRVILVPLSPGGRGVRGEGESVGTRVPLTPHPSPARGEGNKPYRLSEYSTAAAANRLALSGVCPKQSVLLWFSSAQPMSYLL